MKKMIISVIACVALVFGACVAWLYSKDLIAGILILTALVPSCLFEEGRKEYKSGR